MLKQGLNYVKSRMLLRKHKRNPCRVQKTYSWTAAFVLRANGSQMCRLHFDLRTRRNREPATFTLGIFCVRKEISRDQKQLRSRTASTWISLHAHKNMFLQNDCCDVAPPDRLMHTKMLRFRHGGTLGCNPRARRHGSQS